jgi:hypothetical protein
MLERCKSYESGRCDVRETAYRDCLVERSECLSLKILVSVVEYTVGADLDTTRHSSSGVDVEKGTPHSLY